MTGSLLNLEMYYNFCNFPKRFSLPQVAENIYVLLLQLTEASLDNNAKYFMLCSW